MKRLGFLSLIVNFGVLVACGPLSEEVAAEFAQIDVTSNDTWTPFMAEFNGVEMALVPAGCFMMGSQDGGDDELPIHEQCFDEPFWIDVYEVTNEQYGSEGTFSGADRPRESVDWFEATAHCENRGARLPTEAEWEYAARGPDGLTYSWGNSFFDGSLANFCDTNCPYGYRHLYFDDGYAFTSPVGSYPGGASWVGAMDMSGNVSEWVSSIYSDYPYDATDGREVDGGSDSSSPRVLRGGSWFDFTDYLRAAFRVRINPVNSFFDGFRCARSP